MFSIFLNKMSKSNCKRIVELTFPNCRFSVVRIATVQAVILDRVDRNKTTPRQRQLMELKFQILLKYFTSTIHLNFRQRKATITKRFE